MITKKGENGGSSLRGERRPALAALCVVLLASVVSLVGSGLGASSVLAQGASGPFARIWAKKLASGNVEFGVVVYTSSGNLLSRPTINNRYFRHEGASVGTWYHSEALTLRSGSDSVLVAVRARKLASENLEFGLRVYGSDDQHWSPASRYFPYESAATNQIAYSSAFYLRQHDQECPEGAVNNPTANLPLLRDCDTLMASKAALQGTSNRLNNWTGDTPINLWTGVSTGRDELSHPVRVTSLYISGGNPDPRNPIVLLEGTIPKQLGKLTDLRTLFLKDNNLSGEIPAELGNLSKLTNLNLDGNSLSGSIPSELGNLSKLTRLNLDSNSLSGSIPSELGSLSDLKHLQLGGTSGNNLSGSIPAELGNLSKLTQLDLRSNDLSGSIPSGLGSLSLLTDLNLAHNDLSGSIPSGLGSLSSLRHLNLNNNSLSGSIPSGLGSLSSLLALDLSWNKLTGAIPASLGSLTRLFRLRLAKNLLSGPIPSQLGNLAKPTGKLSSIGLRSTALMPGDPGDSDDNPDLSGCIPAVFSAGPGRATVYRGDLPFCSSS